MDDGRGRYPLKRKKSNKGESKNGTGVDLLGLQRKYSGLAEDVASNTTRHDCRLACHAEHVTVALPAMWDICAHKTCVAGQCAVAGMVRGWIHGDVAQWPRLWNRVRTSLHTRPAAITIATKYQLILQPKYCSNCRSDEGSFGVFLFLFPS